MNFLNILRAALKRDEGTGPTRGGRFLPYNDSKGNLTIGYGHNLSSDGLRPIEVELVLDNDIDDALQCVRSIVPGFDSLDDARKAVLANMAFNLEGNLREFHRLLGAVARGDWKSASREMLDSEWAAQVGLRARRLAYEMETGVIL